MMEGAHKMRILCGTILAAVCCMAAQGEDFARPRAPKTSGGKLVFEMEE